MRALVFLLVAANLAFLAWTQGYLGDRAHPDAVRLQQQLGTDKLRVLSRQDAPPETAPVEAKIEKKAEPEKCLAWGGLTSDDAARIETLLGERFADLNRARHVLPEISSWWVFIPPQQNKAEADRKASELKRLGVPEYFIVQDAGANRWAISLGIFSSESAAEERLAALREKGIKSAKVGRRGTMRAEQVTLEASGALAMVDAAREAIAQRLPEAKAAACGKAG